MTIMPELPLTTLLNGTSAVAATLVPLAISSVFFISYAKNRSKRLKAIVGLMFFTLGCFFSGLSISFISLLVSRLPAERRLMAWGQHLPAEIAGAAAALALLFLTWSIAHGAKPAPTPAAHGPLTGEQT